MWLSGSSGGGLGIEAVWGSPPGPVLVCSWGPPPRGLSVAVHCGPTRACFLGLCPSLGGGSSPTHWGSWQDPRRGHLHVKWAPWEAALPACVPVRGRVCTSTSGCLARPPSAWMDPRTLLALGPPASPKSRMQPSPAWLSSRASPPTSEHFLIQAQHLESPRTGGALQVGGRGLSAGPAGLGLWGRRGLLSRCPGLPPRCLVPSS